MAKRKILIVEDEALINEMAKIMISEFGNYEVVGQAYSGEEALKKTSDLQPDLVFLDIRLGSGSSGIEVGRALSEAGIDFIFVTSHSDESTVLNAIQAKPLAYIVKPFDRATLFANLELAFSKKSKEEIFLKDGHETFVIPKKDIMYLKADNIYTEIHSVKGKKVIRNSMKSMSQQLGKEFITVHRSFLVNAKHIKKFGSELEMTDGTLIPVARAQKERLKKLFKITR